MERVKVGVAHNTVKDPFATDSLDLLDACTCILASLCGRSSPRTVPALLLLLLVLLVLHDPQTTGIPCGARVLPFEKSAERARGLVTLVANTDIRSSDCETGWRNRTYCTRALAQSSLCLGSARPHGAHRQLASCKFSIFYTVIEPLACTFIGKIFFFFKFWSVQKTRKIVSLAKESRGVDQCRFHLQQH